MDQKIKKWQKQIKHLIDEILDANERQYVFEVERKIIKNNPALSENNIFLEYLFRNYAESQVLAILRIVDKDGDTGSFVALLNDLLKNYEEIIKSGKLNQKFINDIDNSSIDSHLKDHFKKEREDNKISLEKINSDKFDLLKETAKIKIYRDKWVAHIDRKRVRVVIEFDELNRIINFINSKIQEYYTFLTNSSISLLYTYGLESDKEIFRIAWLTPSDEK
ncbi:MAG: hypothetical protein A3H70_01055 [Candidatus Komeilibacteria bacterium RIFCSPLOWO2_02_FULL_48_11]|uniref:HEPN AbiU2-like domain-containing protein n=1 Tax=Candidatus Komeilibacteria bacterium RIFCSPLOWO2_02_FULL_48_11 TaxID=1798553 RepID=A0A1G2BS92_9BACT|nr:MAG: hypothetical protein A3H70_01055 [Candidatus Komeilibacteria bacterium RIFCSPLOWO2_02_FULL_48_11]